ncbi:MAG: type IV secretion protein IcmK [Proteobacteria bacterium]|nr:type IV secretion protein IcmK [Pseudomonadota bacterium]
MKLKLLFLLQLMAIQPLHAALLGGTNSESSAIPLPKSSTAGENASQQASSSLQSNPAAQQNQGLNPNNINLQDLSKMTPEQSQQLMNQAKEMKPEQLQAIAKSLSSQAQAHASSQVAQQQSNPGQAVAKAQKPINPDAGLIEEVVPAKPAQPLSIEEMKRQQAFNALMDEVLPLSPDQIKDLHRFYDLTLQAKATTPAPPPTPNFTSIVVNLEPGSQPPVIRLSAGFVTSVLFVDSTGASWPIAAYSIGDPQNFNIQWDQKSNALFIQSMKQYSHGNLAVRLWGLDTPVMVTLVSGQRNVDFRVDLQVLGRGPDAKPPVVETLNNAKVNPLLINILDGIPPRDSVKLSVTGGHGEAWLADGRVYFRTKLTVLSPAWTATVSSPDGTHVYEMMLTPFILASQNGKTIDIKLSGL